MNKKLLNKDIKKYRDKQLKKQNGLCALCKAEPAKPVLDHSHVTGHVRQVLCNSCNQAEGRLLSVTKRLGMQRSQLTAFILALPGYWQQDYSKNPIHPTELSENAKELKALKKKLKSVKTDKAKQKYKEMIAEIQALVKLELKNCWKDE